MAEWDLLAKGKKGKPVTVVLRGVEEGVKEREKYKGTRRDLNGGMTILQEKKKNCRKGCL